MHCHNVLNKIYENHIKSFQSSHYLKKRKRKKQTLSNCFYLQLVNLLFLKSVTGQGHFMIQTRCIPLVRS